VDLLRAVNLAAATPNCPFIEYLPEDLCGSNLRKELVFGTPVMKDGKIPLPLRPGLGVELNRHALEKFKQVAARTWEAS
jgi:L-alanine-DL-glutamate epimerase-like enolase superfamily enzyme